MLEKDLVKVEVWENGGGIVKKTEFKHTYKSGLRFLEMTAAYLKESYRIVDANCVELVKDAEKVGCSDCKSKTLVAYNLKKPQIHVIPNDAERHLHYEEKDGKRYLSLSEKGVHTLGFFNQFVVLKENAARKEALLKEEKAVSKKAAPPITPAQ